MLCSGGFRRLRRSLWLQGLYRDLCIHHEHRLPDYGFFDSDCRVALWLAAGRGTAVGSGLYIHDHFCRSDVCGRWHGHLQARRARLACQRDSEECRLTGLGGFLPNGQSRWFRWAAGGRTIAQVGVALRVHRLCRRSLMQPAAAIALPRAGTSPAGHVGESFLALLQGLSWVA